MGLRPGEGKRDRIASETAILLPFALVVALSFGVSFATGNQHSYLLDALRTLDPTFLRRDWYVSETYQYHPAFTRLILALATIGPVGPMSAAAYIVLIIGFGVIVHRIVRVVGATRALAATLLVLLFVLVERTASLGNSFIFSVSIEPSSIAAVAFTGAMLCFIRAWWLPAGLLLLLAGVFHVNFLVLGLLTFGLAYMLRSGWWREGERRSFVIGGMLLLGPGIALALYELPVLLRASGGPDAARALYIFHFIRAPHHYVPRDFLGDLVPFLGWTAATAGLMGVTRAPANVRGRLSALGGTFSVLVIGATVVNTVTFVPTVSQLFFWRLAPFAVLLFQVVVSVALVRLVSEPCRVRIPPWQLTLAAGGLAIIIMSGARTVLVNGARSTLPNVLLALLLIFLVFIILARAFRLPGTALIEPVTRQPAVVVGGVLAAAALWAVSGASWSLDIGGASGGLPEQELYKWVRTTPKDTLFLTPPELETFRLHGQRAIVVDWKSMPVLPAELLEWYRRLCEVSGHQVTSRTDAIDGYRALDEARVERLRGSFAFDYVVVPASSRRLALPVTFEDERYVVYSAVR